MNTLFLLATSIGIGLSWLSMSILNLGSGNLAYRVVLGSSFSGFPSESNLWPILKSLQTSFSKLFSRQRRESIDQALLELLEIIDLFAVCLEAGDNTYNALSRVSSRSEGLVATELKKILRSIAFGGSLPEEIKTLANRINHPQFAELANKISLSLTRGTPLADMLRDQSISLRAEIKNRLLKQVGRNEIRMLIPLVFLMLPVTVMFAVYPSLELMQFSYL